ncbi:MAG: biotin--[acetyl-CoA-carboxylase] ligase [Chitinophagales bacterium]|nr:biotin--[acetyl-CoA-carboxylase] ligase [Chitinophagales bacterium]
MNPSTINTLFTGKFLIQLKEISSTNTFLKDWLSNNKPIDGLVIMADKQSKGKGQSGNSWQAEAEKNLTFSVLFLTGFLKVTEQFLLSMATCLSVYELLCEKVKDKKIEIKWPNDVMIDRKKVCGILIENSIQGSTVLTSIIGIGLNVNQENFPGLTTASSMILNGYQGNVEETCIRLLEILEKNYLFLKSGQYEKIHQRYLQVLLGLNEELLFSDSLSSFKGSIQNVEKDGQLTIKTDDGTRKFYHKEVRFISL